jgi:hypothetical protein
MNGLIGTWLVSLAGPIIKKILLTLGIGLVSYAALSVALNQAINAAKSAWSGMGGDTLALVQLAGVPDAISIIVGAVLARVAMQTVKKFEVLK